MHRGGDVRDPLRAENAPGSEEFDEIATCRIESCDANELRDVLIVVLSQDVKQLPSGRVQASVPSPACPSRNRRSVGGSWITGDRSSDG